MSFIIAPNLFISWSNVNFTRNIQWVSQSVFVLSVHFHQFHCDSWLQCWMALWFTLRIWVECFASASLAHHKQYCVCFLCFDCLKSLTDLCTCIMSPLSDFYKVGNAVTVVSCEFHSLSLTLTGVAPHGDMWNALNLIGYCCLARNCGTRRSLYALYLTWFPSNNQTRMMETIREGLCVWAHSLQMVSCMCRAGLLQYCWNQSKLAELLKHVTYSRQYSFVPVQRNETWVGIQLFFSCK